MNTQRPRKYNNPEDLEELCKCFFEGNGSAIEYCKDFLVMLSDKPPVTGAVLSSRSKSR